MGLSSDLTRMLKVKVVWWVLLINRSFFFYWVNFQTVHKILYEKCAALLTLCLFKAVLTRIINIMLFFEYIVIKYWGLPSNDQSKLHSVLFRLYRIGSNFSSVRCSFTSSQTFCRYMYYPSLIFYYNLQAKNGCCQWQWQWKS